MRTFPSSICLVCTAALITGCAHQKDTGETPIPTILTAQMGRETDPVKTERFIERVSQQPYDTAESTFAAALQYINYLPLEEQGTEANYIKSWQALRYFGLELDQGIPLIVRTYYIILDTLKCNRWTAIRQKAVQLLARITQYEPAAPPPNPFLIADLHGGARPNSLKNLNEAVKTYPQGPVDAVRQTAAEDSYYNGLAHAYKVALCNFLKPYYQAQHHNEHAQ